MSDTLPAKSFSSLFCDPSADIEFESSDGVLFKIHSKHLPSTSFGFSPGEGANMAESQPAKLPESAVTLEILFQFVEPPSESRHYQYPPLVDLDTCVFFALAEAAEKYVVFACMGMCATRMRFDTDIMQTNALDVLNHSFKHGYNDLVLKSITQTLQNCNFELVAEKLTAPGLLAKWLKYYGKWRQVAEYGDQLFENVNATSQCAKLFAKWSSYNRQCACQPDKAGTLVWVDFKVPIQINSLKCPTTTCPCGTMTKITNELREKALAIPSFDSF